MGLVDITWESVQQAIAEHDRLGAQQFLDKYGFRPARRYLLIYNGREYDSKAIVGVAHGHATGKFWRSEDFSGGLATVVRTLQHLGFDARDMRGVPRPPDEAFFGEIPGFPPGTPFANRREVQLARVHRPGQAGICGTGDFGAESIVVSGGYEDDVDQGKVIIYTGHGGRDNSTGLQISDQTYDDSGNAALRTSWLTGAPVRVVRGAHVGSDHAPQSGYRYDGLFSVVDTWQQPGRQGHLVCRYRLEALDRPEGDNETILHTDIVLPASNQQPRRRATFVQRLVRSTPIADYVKSVHDHTCQICGTRLQIAGRGYSEGAHIRALGRGHDGPDAADNVLCLCPNCHTLFDGGALTVDEHLVVWRDGKPAGQLRTDERHAIDPAQLAYHHNHYVNVGKS